MKTKITKEISKSGKGGISANSLVAGIILLIAGTALILWNEGRQKKLTTDLNEIKKTAIQMDNISTIDPALNGKLIHVSGTPSTNEVLTDDIFSISDTSIKLTRIVEYYQVVEIESTNSKDKASEEEKETTYSYERLWVETPQFSDFSNPTRKNYVLRDIPRWSRVSPNVMFGGYTLPSSLSINAGNETLIKINYSQEQIKKIEETFKLNYVNADNSKTDKTNKESILKRMFLKVGDERIDDIANLHILEDEIYIGNNAKKPEIGDVRITFTKLIPCEVSIIAKVSGNSFEEYIAKYGSKFFLIQKGDISIKDMLKAIYYDNMFWAWMQRLLSILLIFGGFKGILGYLANAFPFFERIVSSTANIVSSILGFAWSLILFAITFIYYRPLIGIALFLAAALLIFYLIIRHKKKQVAITVETHKINKS